MKAFKKELKGYRVTGITDGGSSYLIKIYKDGREIDYNRVYVEELEPHESLESKALDMIDYHETSLHLADWGKENV
jgi:hypothetical protein